MHFAIKYITDKGTEIICMEISMQFRNGITMVLLNEEKSCLYTDKSAWTLVNVYAMHFKFLRNNSKQC